MITPRFKLSQDDNSITINVRAPYCSLRELEVDVEDNSFIFVCKPYYLRLILPGDIVDDDRAKSSFDTDSGEFSFTYSKKTNGEDFKDLDLITKLIAPKYDPNLHGSMPIEVISDNSSEKLMYEEPLSSEYGFGFALRVHNDFVHISCEFDEIFEVNPCEVPIQERHKLRLQYDQGKFNSDHYLADFVENEEICELIALKCRFIKDNPSLALTDKDRDFLKDLPNIQYELSKETILKVHNGLLDILFAYCFDQRITQYEGNIESGWNISKLASTLSWLESFDTPEQTLICAFRRSVIYPLYRHFDLSQTVFEDLKALISMEEKFIVKVLIEIYNIFTHGDCGRYILNNLFIKDYIIYVMKWDSTLWKSTVAKVIKSEIIKEELGLNLAEIEEGFHLQEKMALLRIEEGGCDSDDCSSSEDSSSDSSSSSEYSSESETETEDCADTSADIRFLTKDNMQNLRQS